MLAVTGCAPDHASHDEIAALRHSNATLKAKLLDVPAQTQRSGTEASPSPSPALTKTEAAAVIAASPLLEQPGETYRYPRELIGVTGVSLEAGGSRAAEVEFRWRYFTRSDETDLPAHVATSIAHLERFDTGWRMESFSNVEGAADMTDLDRRSEINRLLRRISDTLCQAHPELTGCVHGAAGNRQEITLSAVPPSSATPTLVEMTNSPQPSRMVTQVDQVYIDTLTRMYYREDCTKPPGAINRRMPKTIALGEGYRPSPDCYGKK